MKKINTNGILNINLIRGSNEWYYGTDWAHGALYEAEEAFKKGHSIMQNRLIFIHYPDGKIVTPIVPKEGQYLDETVVFYEGGIVFLMADFIKEELYILKYEVETEKIITIDTIEISSIGECGMLSLDVNSNMLSSKYPFIISRRINIENSNKSKFQIIWPVRIEFDIEENEDEDEYEDLVYIEGENLYFSYCKQLSEEDNYADIREVIVRKFDTGEIIERHKGELMIMPDGQKWILN